MVKPSKTNRLFILIVKFCPVPTLDASGTRGMKLFVAEGFDEGLLRINEGVSGGKCGEPRAKMNQWQSFSRQTQLTSSAAKAHQLRLGDNLKLCFQRR